MQSRRDGLNLTVSHPFGIELRPLRLTGICFPVRIKGVLFATGISIRQSLNQLPVSSHWVLMAEAKAPRQLRSDLKMDRIEILRSIAAKHLKDIDVERDLQQQDEVRIGQDLERYVKRRRQRRKADTTTSTSDSTPVKMRCAQGWSESSPLSNEQVLNPPQMFWTACSGMMISTYLNI